LRGGRKGDLLALMIEPGLFILAVLSLLATPGPTNTLLATSGATVGVRRSLVLLAGELGGYLIAIAGLRLVLGPVIAAQPMVGVALKVAVALYLAWIAVALWRRGSSLTGEGAVTLRGVFMTTLLNPKALVFAFGIIPAAHPMLWAYVLGFAGTVSLVGFGWIVVGSLIGAASGERHAGLVQKLAAVALVGFAALLVRSTFG
jgi:threonine/homoserine/homoserine lactone efflux protein